jgi:hypothetical protein
MVDLQFERTRFVIGRDDNGRNTYEHMDPDSLEECGYTLRTNSEGVRFTPYRRKMSIIFKSGAHSIVKPDDLPPNLLEGLDLTVTDILRKPDMRIISVPESVPRAGVLVARKEKKVRTFYREERDHKLLLVRDLLNCAGDMSVGQRGHLTGWHHNPGYLVPLGIECEGGQGMTVTNILFVPNMAKNYDEELFNTAYLISWEVCLFIQDMEAHLTMNLMFRTY